jgi:hypothetical protein
VHHPAIRVVHRRALDGFSAVRRQRAIDLRLEQCVRRHSGLDAQAGQRDQRPDQAGLVPSEYSSGDAVHRGHITKAGNAHLRTQLIESAWAYQHHPNLGVTIRRRQEHVDPAARPLDQ